MRATRSATWSFSALLGLLLALALALPTQAGDEAGPQDTVTVLCEVWRVTAPEVLAEVEAITERRPAAAEEVRRRLLDGGGERLARLLTPAVQGEPVSLSNLRRIPQMVRSTSSSGTVTTRSGYQEVGTRLQMLQQRVGEGRVALELDLRVTVPWAGGADVPATQGTLQLQTTITAPLGALRMFLSRAGDGDAVVVFLRATALDAPEGDEPAPRPAGTFSAAEIERFRVLRRLVAEEERRTRYEEMFTRQLERSGVTLTEEQTRTVLYLTTQFREAMREALREMPRGAAGQEAGRDAWQATLEALRQDYADKLGAVLDAETAQKIVEWMGRAPGFGRER